MQHFCFLILFSYAPNNRTSDKYPFLDTTTIIYKTFVKFSLCSHCRWMCCNVLMTRTRTKVVTRYISLGSNRVTCGWWIHFLRYKKEHGGKTLLIDGQNDNGSVDLQFCIKSQVCNLPNYIIKSFWAVLDPCLKLT